MSTQSASKKERQPLDYSMPSLCGWRQNLESDKAGEFWIDREALTQRMSQLSEIQRAMYRWGVVDEFNKGLDQILRDDQSVGEMRNDLREQRPPWLAHPTKGPRS